MSRRKRTRPFALAADLRSTKPFNLASLASKTERIAIVATFGGETPDFGTVGKPQPFVFVPPHGERVTVGTCRPRYLVKEGGEVEATFDVIESKQRRITTKERAQRRAAALAEKLEARE